MNEREKELEPFVMDSDEFFIKMSTNPKKYPLMLFNPNVSRKVMRAYSAKFHVIGVTFRDRPTFAMAYGYYKKMPDGAKEPQKMSKFKIDQGVENVLLPFEGLTHIENAGHFMVIGKSLPQDMIDHICKLYWVVGINYNNELRQGVLCVYFDKSDSIFEGYNDPLSGQQMRVVGSWMEG